MLDRILKSAGRRHLANLALEHAAIAAGIGAAGVVALLVLGTQILNWYWPVLLFVTALAVGLGRAWRRRLSRYRLAQALDARLGLEDRLSTCVWFADHDPAAREALGVVEKQAADRVRPDDAARAFPVHTPRYAWAALALVVAAAGMLGVRYGVLHTMDLSRPIASIDLSAFQPEPKVHAATRKSAIQERYEQQLKELGITPEQGELMDPNALKPIETSVPGKAEQGDQPGQPGQKGKTQQSAPENGDGPEGSDEQAPGDGVQTGDQQAGDQPQKGQQGKQQPNAPQNAKNGSSGSQDGLMNKMKDALANLMNKLKTPPQQQSEQQQTAMNQQGQQSRQGQQGQQGQQSKSKSQGEGSESQEQQGDQEAQDGKAAGDKSKSGDKSSDKPGSQNSKSGMGQSDGDKDIRDAEQVAAMGKISEIFGKRAQQLTGEITVEVASGKQQLKTAWSERKSTHSDSGSEVNRDEIPIAYHSYIQRYFEEVRKSAAKTSSPAAKPKS